VASDGRANRASLLAAVEEGYERAQRTQRDRESGQTSLFGALSSVASEEPATDSFAPGGAANASSDRYPQIDDWPLMKRLSFERESLGFYVTGHPLDRYETELHRHADATTQDLVGKAANSDVRIGGIVGNYRERSLKSGKGRMAIFSLEDQYGAVEVVVFSRAFAQYEQILKGDGPVFVEGRVTFEGDGEAVSPRILLSKVSTLADLRTHHTRDVCLRFSADCLTNEHVGMLQQIVRRHAGDCRIIVELALPNRSTTRLSLSERFMVQPTDELMNDLENIFGKHVAIFR
jgi:DNA polymerase-3 subunit alpha